MEQETESSQRDYNIPKSSRYKQNNEAQNPQSNDESRNLHETQSCTTVELTEYEDDDVDDEDEEEEEDENNVEDVTFKLEAMRYADARMGVCSVCRYSITSQDASPADFEKALLCSDGHLLCHRCVTRFAIQSDMSCVLCAATEAHHNSAIEAASSVSRASSVKSIKSKRRNRTDGLRSRRDRRACKVPVCASHTNVSHYNEQWGETEDERSPRLSRHRSYCSITQKEEPPRAQINSQMMSECSRRPIQCPRLDCAVNVAFSALTNHFLFDHPEVPILSVDPGEKSTLIVNFDGLMYDSSRCLALLLVSGKLSGPAARQFNGNHVHPRYKNRLPLPILAARLRCNASRISGEHNRDDGRDVVIAWVAGLDIGNTTTGALRCSIQAIDSIDGEAAFRSLTYTGPINSLRTAQQPREVFLTGDCVILHDGFIGHITSGCENLNVNVTIH